MYKDLDEFINENFKSKKTNLSVRIQPEIHEIVNRKFDTEKRSYPYLEYSDFIRNIIAFYVLPEILEAGLEKEFNRWISQPGAKKIEMHYGEKIRKLETIISTATQALEMTHELQEKIIQMEVEYLDKVNTLSRNFYSFRKDKNEQ